MTRITFDLSEKGITSAIKALAAYQVDLQTKIDTFRVKVAERIAELAKNGFENAIVSDVISDVELAKVDADVKVTDGTNVTTVIASGADVIWIEFGAGVYHNGAAGSSPHPNGKQLGFTIGSFGKGYGKRAVWGYYNEDNELVLTRGTPAAMPMYNATKIVCEELTKIAKEVFK